MSIKSDIEKYWYQSRNLEAWATTPKEEIRSDIEVHQDCLVRIAQAIEEYGGHDQVSDYLMYRAQLLARYLDNTKKPLSWEHVQS